MAWNESGAAWSTFLSPPAGRPPNEDQSKAIIGYYWLREPPGAWPQPLQSLGYVLVCQISPSTTLLLPSFLPFFLSFTLHNCPFHLVSPSLSTTFIFSLRCPSDQHPFILSEPAFTFFYSIKTSISSDTLTPIEQLKVHSKTPSKQFNR